MVVVLATSWTSPSSPESISAKLPAGPAETDTNSLTERITLFIGADFNISAQLSEEPLIIYKKEDSRRYASMEIEKSKTFDPGDYPYEKKEMDDWQYFELNTWEENASPSEPSDVANAKYIYFKKVGDIYVTATEFDYTGGEYDKELEEVLRSLEVF